MSERSILAYFKTPHQAERAADQLKSLGITDVRVDRFSAFPGGSADELMNPLTGNINSQAEMTLGTITSHEAGVLASADVGASGMSDGGADTSSGRNIVLAAVLDEDLFEQARDLVHGQGGLV
ncbi:Hypothetical protein DEACI_1102 [Acididesulfobacillus acetoxydans]|uniref:Uncharacterized protein n=1 Tax=Acididesulfobacillus acetoxydans TaxID=1561005 RepID=A0A8S0W780_9FIRM|nr:hypothetical protein [Acididesulfobacillus acetoxydans]CAA7600449.1 Hypothetical protein DEACI_1102 [Acididesulfobacillus acetoxydans]CEJ06583.1 Hypothetical protein DEACI_1032 [Acididesulfobacillus acetoxydans]